MNRTEIIIKHPNVTLQYAELCKDGMTRVGTYDEITSGELGYRLRVGDEAGFLQSPYVRYGRSMGRKYPLIVSTVVMDITEEGVLFEDKYCREESAFVTFDDLQVKPVDITRCKFDIKALLQGKVPTTEWDGKTKRFVHRSVFSQRWPRCFRLDRNLSNFVWINEQQTLFN